MDGKRTALLKKLASGATLASAMNDLAWNLAVDPDPLLRDPAQAVELARKAVDLAPMQGSYWNTLGTAYYRAGDWNAAIDTLTRADELSAGGNFSFNAFFLAMAHWQRGENEQALKWYGPALVWMEKHAAKNEVLLRFRAEAASLLALSEKLTPEQELARADDLKLYTLVLEAHPKAAWAHGTRGSAYAEWGQWKEAMAEFAKAAELKKAEPLHSYRQALARLQLGDVAGYRKLCADILRQSGSAAQADAALWAVWTCALAPDAVADWSDPLRLAEKAVADNPKSFRALNHCGAVLYRAGRYEESLRRLTEAEAAYQPGDEKLSAIAYNWLFLALAHHRLGHGEEAKNWHDKAVQWIDHETQGARERAANPFSWNRRLTLQLLLREAEELLASKSGL